MSDETKINSLGGFLKSNFFGIDTIIDEIVDKIQPWHVFPDAMMRPMIINLWGMTGTGKTQLVRDIATHLGTQLIQIDLGEYVGAKEKNLGLNFYTRYSDLSGRPSIILIDEFHIARTKDATGAELDRESIRSLWHLLSDGIVCVDINHLQDSMMMLEYKLENAVDGYWSFRKALVKKEDEYGTKISPDNVGWYKKHVEKPHMMFHREGIDIPSLSRVLKYKSPKKLIAELDSGKFEETCISLKERMEKVDIQPKLDFSKSLIFVVGNLDEIYNGSEVFDPDMDLELLQERNQDLTISDVKECLFQRFRVEQISRLGNNHIIYPVLDKDAYHQIILKDLKRVKEFYSKKKIILNFDDSVKDIIYSEGLFPNQGARSVLSTVGALLEPALIKFYYKSRKAQLSKETQHWTCSYESFSKKFVFSLGSKKIEIPAQLKLSDSRTPVVNQNTVTKAIHEAGHAIACVIHRGIIPKKSSIFKVNGNGTVEHSTESRLTGVETFDRVKNDIIVGTSGFMAEKIVFGENNITTGAWSDIEKITKSALMLVQSCGYYERISMARVDNSLCHKLVRTESYEEKCKKIISDCEEISYKTIKKNIHFLKDIATALLKNSVVTDKDIKKIMKADGVSCPENPDFVKVFRNL